MTYRISYIDTSPSQTREQQVAERTEYYTSWQAALARSRELLERVECHRVLISCPRAEGGVCLKLKVGFTSVLGCCRIDERQNGPHLQATDRRGPAQSCQQCAK
jgi:hypothetical protein